MSSTPEIFASMVFDDVVMKSRLDAKIYKSLKRTIDEGAPLDPSVADAVAAAMKEWAIDKGATHYTHWFQPLTGITAGKHECFITPSPDGRVLMEFSGKELIQGEPDASSFPSGGLRATFEARGYTAWDPTSYAFIKDNTLCIPTAFCAYGGEALDKKTPLLRSMQAINKQALRILRLFGNNDVKRVITCSGAEQEYFLIDRELYLKRKDLMFTGRTLFGAKPPKGQEMDDHYFGAIKPRVKAFMEELDTELWKLGVLAKTEHNEAAPSQYELAPVYTTTNVATDHNQIVMEVMQHVAQRHGLVCLLHEKPFEGVNGSGKHNNWSMATDTGHNLLSPGETPYENAQFLLFLCAVIKGVDEYQELLRMSVSVAGNDHRLGAHEAPPAVVSVFLGDELTAVLEAIENDTPYDGVRRKSLKLGVDVLPRLPQDTTDRNRTSPFAFTGNKFEFRMVGASDSISCANVITNAAVAESLRQFADKLEKAENFEEDLHALIKETIGRHKRIIFNGNGYDAAWIKEAVEVRGLSNLSSCADAIPHMLDEKNVKLLSEHGIFTPTEVKSRCEINLENYCKHVQIEANTMVEMARRQILPAIEAFGAALAGNANAKMKLNPDLACRYERGLVAKLSAITDEIDQATSALELAISLYPKKDMLTLTAYIRDNIVPCMESLRRICDEAETVTAKEYWPFPTYSDLLFSIN